MRSLLLSIILAAPALALSPDAKGEVVPRELSWDQLGRVFDMARTLPARPRRGTDLVRDMRALLALRFEVSNERPGAAPYRSFGDLAARSRALRPKERPSWLSAVVRRSPFLRVHEEVLRELLLDDQFTSKGWDPDDDEPRDGFLLVEPWDLASEKRAPWKDLEIDPSVEQGATLVWADLFSFKAAENDYRDYGDDIGASYEEIYPVPGTFFRGIDPEGREFSTLRVYSRSDLPWPYSDYKCDVRVLNRIDGSGNLVTDVYSTSEDFHWLGGRDVFLPVVKSDGTWVANLVVRLYGFDLDGVPDRAKHRRAALRGSLGNLKLEAQRIFAEAGAPVQQAAGVPAFRLFAKP